MLGNDCLKTANQSRDCSVYLGQHWAWKLRMLQSESQNVLKSNERYEWPLNLKNCDTSVVMWYMSRFSCDVSERRAVFQKDASKGPAEEVKLQMNLTTKRGKQDVIRTT